MTQRKFNKEMDYILNMPRKEKGSQENYMRAWSLNQLMFECKDFSDKMRIFLREKRT